MPAYPSAIQLPSLDGSNGFKIAGAAADGSEGRILLENEDPSLLTGFDFVL